MSAHQDGIDVFFDLLVLPLVIGTTGYAAYRDLTERPAPAGSRSMSPQGERHSFVISFSDWPDFEALTRDLAASGGQVVQLVPNDIHDPSHGSQVRIVGGSTWREDQEILARLRATASGRTLLQSAGDAAPVPLLSALLGRL